MQPDSQQRNIKSVRAARVQKKGSLFDADDDLGAEESDVKIGDLMVTSLLEYEKPSDAELLSNRPSTGAAASDIDALLADDDNVGAKSTAASAVVSPPAPAPAPAVAAPAPAPAAAAAADADDLDGDLFGMLDSGAGSEQASTADANAFDISKYINSNS